MVCVRLCTLVPGMDTQVVEVYPLLAVGSTGEQLVTRSGPCVFALQVVVRKLESVPGVQAATGVGLVVAVAQLTTGSTPRGEGTHAPEATPTVVSVAVQVVRVKLLALVGASLVQAVPGASCCGCEVLTEQLVTLKLASTPSVHAATRAGPVFTVLQLVVVKLPLVPGVQVPCATKVGPVVTVLQLICLKPLSEVGAWATQVPAATPTTGLADTQLIVM